MSAFLLALYASGAFFTAVVVAHDAWTDEGSVLRSVGLVAALAFTLGVTIDQAGRL